MNITYHWICLSVWKRYNYLMLHWSRKPIQTHHQVNYHYFTGTLLKCSRHLECGRTAGFCLYLTARSVFLSRVYPGGKLSFLYVYPGSRLQLRSFKKGYGSENHTNTSLAFYVLNEHPLLKATESPNFDWWCRKYKAIFVTTCCGLLFWNINVKFLFLGIH